MGNELIKWDKARQAIAECKTIDEVKQIKDKAEAMRAYSKQIGESLSCQNDLAEIKLRAERRAGEMLAEMEFTGKGGDRKSESSNIMSLDNLDIEKHESSRWQAIARISEDKFEEIIEETKEASKELTESMMLKVEKEISKEKKKDIRKRDYEKASKTYNNDDIKIHNIDFYDYANTQIDDNSIDAIITDPPYPKEYLPLWEKMFEVANRILKPSSFLITYANHQNLDKIFRLKNELIYYWIFKIDFTMKPIAKGRNLIATWKPVLIYQKAPFKKIEDTIEDTIKFDYSERDLHNNNWGQTIAPFEYIIEKFTKPNDIIFEPFAGTGTTLIASKNRKRRCIGCETDNQYIPIIKGRLV